MATSLLSRRYRRRRNSAHTVTDLRAEDNYTLWLRFDDGVEGHVYLADLVSTKTYRDLGNEGRFYHVAIDPVSNVVAWEGGLRLDAEVLYLDVMSRRYAPLH